MNRRVETFQTVGSHSVVEAIVKQIEELIIDGILTQGTKLPSERELAEQLSVSRAKLREALQRLEQTELITSRQGDGNYVGRLTGEALSPAMTALYARHERGFDDYMEYRREIEIFTAGLAAERATDTDKQAIKDCLERQAEGFTNPNSAASLEEDIRFHRAITEAAHNSMLTHTTASLYALTEQGIMYNRAAMSDIQSAPKRLLDQHAEIASAIFLGDAAGARAFAEAHMDYVAEAVREFVATKRRKAVAGKRSVLRSAQRN